MDPTAIPCVYHDPPIRSVLERVKNHLREKEQEIQNQKHAERNSERTTNSRATLRYRGADMQREMKPKKASLKIEAVKKHLCSCPSSSSSTSKDNLIPISSPLNVIDSFPQSLESVQISLKSLLSKYENHLVILNYVRVLNALLNGIPLTAPKEVEKEEPKLVQVTLTLNILRSDVGVFISKKGFKDILPENMSIKVRLPSEESVNVEITAPTMAEIEPVKAALELRVEKVNKAREIHRKNLEAWQIQQQQYREALRERREKRRQEILNSPQLNNRHKSKLDNSSHIANYYDIKVAGMSKYQKGRKQGATAKSTRDKDLKKELHNQARNEHLYCDLCHKTFTDEKAATPCRYHNGYLLASSNPSKLKWSCCKRGVDKDTDEKSEHSRTGCQKSDKHTWRVDKTVEGKKRKNEKKFVLQDDDY